MHSIPMKFWKVLVVGLSLILVITGTAAIPAERAGQQKSSIMKLEIWPYRKNICINKKVTLTYSILFDREAYFNQTYGNELAPLAPLIPKGDKKAGPAVDVTPSQGGVSWDKKLKTKDDPVADLWVQDITYTPDTAGEATVDITASYYSITVKDKWTFNVKPCKYDVEISADESGARMSSGQTFNEAQNFWQILIYLKGKVTGVEVEDTGNKGVSGGTQRLSSGFNPLWNNDPFTGTADYFGDGIWLGNAEDLTCGTRGAFTCSNEFDVSPEIVDDTLKLQIVMRSGQCSGFTVWCKGSGGGGEGSIPPMKSLEFSMSADIPVEGGSSHYVHVLPYGITFDILVSAYPEVEE